MAAKKASRRGPTKSASKRTTVSRKTGATRKQAAPRRDAARKTTGKKTVRKTVRKATTVARKAVKKVVTRGRDQSPVARVKRVAAGIVEQISQVTDHAATAVSDLVAERF